MGSRSQKIIISTEGKVLRELRLKQSLSMRAAGAAMGYSDSYISQIENGRADPPKGEALLKFLRLYGEISPKYFGELARNWTAKKTDADYVIELLPRL
jgi:HTH-type transcriptional regulator, competence development regulator